MASTGQPEDIGVLGQIIAALKSLAPEDRARIIQTVATFFQIDPHRATTPVSRASAAQGAGPGVDFSEDLAISPKEFLLEKKPRTDVERIACLSYYLTHYRSMPEFKTIDLSKLNTEAAQPKFANAAWSAQNALKRGYLAPASRGSRQISAAGEQFVRTLPDREAAKAFMASMSLRRRNARKKAEEAPQERYAS